MNTQTVILDVSKRRATVPTVRIRQGDVNGTILNARMFDDGAVLDLTGRTVKFAMRAPKGAGYYEVDGTASGNVATFTIDETYAGAVSGTTENAYVQVLEGGVVCSTGDLRVVVLRDATDGVDPATMYNNGLNEAIERANAAAEAAEEAAGGTVPTMSTAVKGGAKLGSGLEVVSDTLSIDLTDEATGESVTAADASYLASLTVDGKAVQDGTPTPSAPVPVETVSGINLFTKRVATSGNGITLTVDNQGVCTLNGTATGSAWFTLDTVLPAGTYTLSANNPVANSGVRVTVEIDGTYPTYSLSTVNTQNTFTASTGIMKTSIVVNSGTVLENFVIKPQLEAGSTATPYIPYGSIGLKVGSTITPINLQGNVLASLSDGTKDVLTVDSVGHCVLEKRTHVWNMKDYATNAGWIKSSSAINGYYLNCTYLVPKAATGSMGNCSCNMATPRDNTGDYFIMPNSCIVDSNFNFNLDAAVVGSTLADFKTWLASNDLYMLSKLATPQTIDLGYIDMPAILDGATISITAQVTPTISASWWARGAAAIAEALKAVRARIDALQAAIAELAAA